MASLVTTTVAGTASITATTNDGSTAPLTVTQAGTARAAYVTRNVASATRAMADFGQLSASGGAHPALHIQQTTTASDALRITSDGATAKFAVTGTGALTGTTATFSGDVRIGGATKATSWHAVSILTGGFIAQYEGTNINRGVFSYASATALQIGAYDYGSASGGYKELQLVTNSLAVTAPAGATFTGDITVSNNSTDVDWSNNSNTVSTGGGGIMVSNQQSLDNTFSSIMWVAKETAGTDQNFSIINQSTAATTYTPKVYFAQRTGGNQFTAALTIDESQNVGIGTTSPSGLLDLYDPASGDNKLRFHNSSTGTGTSNGSRIGLNGHELFINNLESSTIKIYTQSTQTNGICIANDGKVGVGTVTPGKKLHIYSGASGATESSDVNMVLEGASNVGLAMLAPNNQGSRIEFGSVADGNEGIIYYNNTGSYFSIYTNGLRQVDITSDGKVGINSTNPSTILSLGGSLATGGIYINSGADEDHTIIDMTGITGGGKLIWDDSEEAFSMSKGLRVTAGSVGIGTTAPSNLLSVEGSVSGDYLAEFKQGHSTAGQSYGVNITAGTNASDQGFRVANQAQSTLMEVRGDGEIRVAGQTLVDSANTNYKMTFPNNSGIAMGSAYTFANIYGNAGNIYLRANAYPANTGSTSKIYLQTTNSGGGQASDVVVNNGQVGIGTAEPATTLDVNGIITSRDLIKIGAAGIHGQITFLSDRLILNGASGKALSLGTNGAWDKLFMDTAGKVGIGTTGPSVALEIKTPASADAFKIIDRSSSDVIVYASFGSTSDEGLFDLLKNNLTKVRLRANGVSYFTGGGVAIGTTALGGVSKLEVQRAARTTVFNAGDGDTWHDLIVRNPTNSSNAASGITFLMNNTYHKNAGTGIAAIAGPTSDYSASLAFITRPHAAVAVERMRIQYDGNVGIGTTAPAYKLDVNGAARIIDGISSPAFWFRASSTAVHCWQPKGGWYHAGGNTHTGAIRIKLPPMHDAMVTFWVDVYDYRNNENFSVYVGGYPYASPNPTWSYTSAVIIGGVARNFTVRFGDNNLTGSSTEYYVYIGETDSEWNHPQVVVRDVFAGYHVTSSEWEGGDAGWGVSFATSFANIANTQSNTLPYGDYNKLINVPASSGVTGTGTDNYVPRWNGTTALQNSSIYADDNGNVGVGNAVPGNFKLNVSGAVYASGSVVIANGTPYFGALNSAGAAQQLLTLNSSNQLLLGSSGIANSGYPARVLAKYITFEPAGTLGAPVETMRVTNASFNSVGSVGIGIAAPVRLLHVYSGTENDVVANFSSLSNSSSAPAAGLTTHIDVGSGHVTNGVARITGHHNLYQDSRSYLSFSTNSGSGVGEKMRIMHDGNVGIGTTSPTRLLDVNGTSYFRDDIYFGNTVLNPASGFNTQIGMGWDKSTGQFQIAASSTTALQVGRITTAGVIQQWRYAGTVVASLESSGQVRSLSGAVSAPSFSFTNDTTTGMSRPTTSALNFITNATEQVRIDANGKVGIGTITPAAKLHVYTGSYNTPKLILQDTGGGAGLVNQIEFRHYTDGRVQAYIKDEILSGWPTKLHFGTANSSNAPTTKMTIDGGGNVGIGTASPSKNLHIRSTVSGSTGIIIENTNNAQNLDIDYWNNAGAVQGRIRYSEGAGDFYIYPNTSALVAFAVKWDGKVGIATATPNYKLEVRGTDNNQRLGIQPNTATAKRMHLAYNSYLSSNTNWYGSYAGSTGMITFYEEGVYQTNVGGIGFNINRITSDNTAVGVNPAPQMIITTDGNVGIGTASPGKMLDVAGDIRATVTGAFPSGLLVSGSHATNGPVVQVANTATNGNAWNMISNGSGNTSGVGHLQFWNSTDSRWNLILDGDSSDAWFNGNVGIGTDSPGGLLDLATTGGTAKPDALRISNAANASYYWDIWRDNTTGYLNFGSVSGASLVTSLVIKDVTGYVGIGTTAPAALLHVHRGTYSNVHKSLILTNSSNTPFSGTTYDSVVINQDDVPCIRMRETGNNVELTFAVGNEYSNSATIGTTGMFKFATNRSVGQTGYIDQNTRMVILADGKIGIGTNNPLNILTLHQAAGANIRFQNATTGRYFIVGEGVGANDKFSFRGNSYRSTDTLTVDFANNRVGVNNISPSKTLDVHGDIWLGASGTSILGGAGDIHIYADNAKVEEYWTSGSDYMFKSYHDDIRYPALGTKGMSIGSDVAPRAILDITGNNSTGMFNAGLGTRTISGTQSFALAPAGTVTVSGNESGMIGSCSSVTVSGNRTLVMGLDNTLAIGTVSTSSILSIMGGSVGIGTTNPSQKLYVHGNIVVNAQILTPSGSNLALNPNTGLVTVGGALQTTSWLTVGGALTASSLATSAATGVVATAAGGGWNPAFHSKNTNADSAPSYITLEKISASPAVSDYIGGIVMKGRTSTGVHRSFVEQWCVATNVTNGSEGARWNCGTWKLGVEYPTTLVCAGNDVGMGVIPTAVNTSHRSLQIGGNANIQSYGTKGAGGEVDYCHNVYLNQDGNYKLISADEGTMYRQGAGKHQFYSWASGTAGSNVSVNAAARLVNIEASGNATFAGALTTAGRITLSNDGSNNGLFIGGGWQIFDNASELHGSTGGLSFYHGGARLVIGDTGKVGIGTTNPGQLLEVGNDGNSDYALIGPTKIGGGMGHGDYAGFSHRSMGGTGNYCLLQYSNGNTYLNTASGGTVSLRVNNSNILNLTGSLATFYVSAKFDGGIKDKNNSTGSASQVLHADGAGKVYWTAAGGGSGTVTGTGTDNYVPRWNGTTALQNSAIYAKDDGKVGIGTTNPGTWKLRVEGSGFFNGSVVIPNGSNYFGAYDSSGTLKNLLYLSSSNQLIINADGAMTQSTRIEGKYISFATPDSVLGSETEVMRVFQGVGFGAAGCVGIGVTTPSSKLDVNGTITGTSKNFNIPHPDPSKINARLVHASVEAPSNDTLYKFEVVISLDNETVTHPLPSYFKYLNKNPQMWIQARNMFSHAYGSCAEDLSSFSITGEKAGSYDVLIIATRKDEGVKGFEVEVF